MKVKILGWDSHFFNKKIGEIEINDEIYFSSDIHKFDLLYIKQKNNNCLKLKNFKENYSETKVVFSKNISKSNNPLNRFVFSAFNTVVNKEQIYKLAFESGNFSRFRLDSNFKQHEFEALYITWVDNSFSKELADDILIYKKQNSILGFVTYKVIDDYAKVGLIGVCNDHQGKGIGTALLLEVENKLCTNHLKELRIPTQLQNKLACKFYTKLGYHIIEKTIIKNYWKL